MKQNLLNADVLAISNALRACSIGGIDTAVFSEGLVRGLGEKKNGAIFSPVELSLNPSITLGIARIRELDKRISLFGNPDSMFIEAEITDDETRIKKLNIKGKNGNIDFRCTDARLIKYPKVINDTDHAMLTLSTEEAKLLIKGARTLGAEQIVLQLKKDGILHFECSDVASDKFMIDISEPGIFLSDVIPMVHSYDITSNGVLLSMLDHAAKSDEIKILLKRSGNLRIIINGLHLLSIPRVQPQGNDNDD